MAATVLPTLVALSPTGWSRDLEKELWLYADFDSPMRVDGTACLQAPVVGDAVDGKFGKAAFFHQPVANRLPPMSELFPDGYPVKVGGGAFTLPPQKIDHPFVKGEKPTGAYTCSFYAKGAPGTQLTLEATLSPSEKGDELRTDSVTLTAAVQRVWTWATFDRRTVEKRKILLKVTASAPVTLERFQYERTLQRGRASTHPGKWVEGGTSQSPKPFVLKDRSYFRTFPAPCGSFSAWIRRLPDEAAALPIVWNCCRGDQAYGFNGDLLYAGGSRRNGALAFPKWRQYLGGDGWHHVAGTWSPERQAIWVDGACVAETTKPMAAGKAGGATELHIGGELLGNAVGDVAIDDLAVFRSVLADDEIRELAKGKGPVLAESRQLVAAPVVHTLYNRDQTNAAIRLRVVAPRKGTMTLEGEIAGRAVGGRKVALEPGVNALALPFDPVWLKVGKHPWRVALKGADGEVALERSGELEILPRLDRDGFLYMSWGGNETVSCAFMRKAGINASNVYLRYDPSGARIDELVRNGLYVNVRYENGWTWRRYGFGPESDGLIAEKAARDLAPLEGIHAWRSTLVNSEVYYVGGSRAAFKMPDYVALARKAIGCEPDFCILQGGLPTYDYKARKEQPPRGVLSKADTCARALATLDWFNGGGHPFVQVAEATMPTVRRMSGGGTVWTEPVSVPSEAKAADMVADWFYGYGTRKDVLRELLWIYGKVRSYNKAFMPTLSMYFDDFSGRHPNLLDKQGRPLRVALSPSVDEYQVKCWIAIGAARADALSVFSANTWERGAAAAKDFLADPKTRAVSCIAEPDAPERSGAFVRSRLLPAAELLRGIANVRSPIALLAPSVTFPIGGFGGWAGYRYPREVSEGMAESCLPYDVIADPEITPEVLSGYRYIAWPMAAVARPEHDAAVRAAAEKGSAVVLDGYAALTYPGAERVAKQSKDSSYRAWFTNRAEKVRALLPSLSTCDAGEGFTFEKRFDGVRFVTVVNDRRRPHDAGGLLTAFCTNVTYRPYGAPQRITTTIRNVPEGAAVYVFNAGGKVEGWKSGKEEGWNITRDFEAAEGIVYCVYPRPLEAPTLKLEGGTNTGGKKELVVRIREKGGKPAPGRQVVRLELKGPDGALRDESGLYAVKGGEARIRLLLSPEDLADTSGSRWQATVTDLTTGETAVLEFTMRDARLDGGSRPARRDGSVRPRRIA